MDTHAVARAFARRRATARRRASCPCLVGMYTAMMAVLLIRTDATYGKDAGI